MKGNDTSVNQITEGVIWKQLLLFFFPILLGTFFQQLYNTADTVVVGRFVGKEALASVGGSTAQIANLVVGFFVGLASGATVVISPVLRGQGPGAGEPVASHCLRLFHRGRYSHHHCGNPDGILASGTDEYAAAADEGFSHFTCRFISVVSCLYS